MMTEKLGEALVKSVIFVVVIVGLGLLIKEAIADHIHNWTLQSEFEDRNGRVVCEWECAEDYDNPHWRKTSGQGGCSRPMS